MKESQAKGDSAGDEMKVRLANYDVGSTLGRSDFGRMFSGRRSVDGVVVAIKEVIADNGKYSLHEAMRMGKLWKEMSRPGVATCYDAFVQDGRYYLVTEQATRNPGDMETLIREEGRPVPDSPLAHDA